MALSRETLISMVKNEYPSSYSSDVEKMSHEDLMGLLDYLDSIKGKADGGVIGIEVKIADEMAKGGRVGLFSGGALKGLASLLKPVKIKLLILQKHKQIKKCLEVQMIFHQRVFLKQQDQ